MKIILFVIIFFLLGAFFIISEHNLKLANPSDRTELGKFYFNWLGQIFENSRNVVGYVIKLDWLPSGNTTG